MVKLEVVRKYAPFVILLISCGRYLEEEMPGLAIPETSEIYAIKGAPEFWGTPGRHWDFTLDEFGIPHIAFYDHDESELKYARLVRRREWKITSVDQSGDVGLYPSVFFVGDSLRVVYVRRSTDFITSDYSIREAEYKAGRWFCRTIFRSGAREIRNLSVAYSKKIYVGFILSRDRFIYMSWDPSEDVGKFVPCEEENLVRNEFIMSLYQMGDFETRIGMVLEPKCNSLKIPEELDAGVDTVVVPPVKIYDENKYHAFIYDWVKKGLVHMRSDEINIEDVEERLNFKKVTKKIIGMLENGKCGQKEVSFYIATLSNYSTGVTQDMIITTLRRAEFPYIGADGVQNWYLVDSRTILIPQDRYKVGLKIEYKKIKPWDVKVIEQKWPTSGLFPSAAITNFGNVMVTFFNYPLYALEFGIYYDDEDRWHLEIVDGGGKGKFSVGSGASIAMTPSADRIVLVYYDQRSNDMKIAMRYPEGWQTRKVATIASSGVRPIGKMAPDKTNVLIVFTSSERDGVKFKYVIFPIVP